MQGIKLVKGDITTLDVDVIVNAANSGLRGGGGVDGAIHRAAGPALLEACEIIKKKQGGCPTGHVVMTIAGNLKAKAVCHAVGPVWRGGNHGEPDALKNCYLEALTKAVEHGFESIAFPNISTGIYGFPKQLAAQIAIDTVKKFSQKHPWLNVLFVCFDEENYEIYKGEL